MTSPDLRGYHDLLLFDRLPADLVERALEDAAVKMPDWVPRAGNTEVVLIEALALIVAEHVYALNRMPGAITEILIRLFGIERAQGVAPTATVTFALADTMGHTIPINTRVRLGLDETVDPVEFTTDVEAVAAAGSGSVNVPVTATRATGDANGTPAGTSLEMVSAIAYVDAVTLATSVTAGSDPEDEVSWRDRATETFSRLVSTLVLPQHFTSAALDSPAVHRATTLDNYDPGQLGAPGDHPGHVTVAVAGSGGALLAAADKTTLEGDLEAKALANLDVHIIDPTITTVAVDVTVVRRAGYTDQQVVDAVTAALDAYLDPDTWDWAGTVWRNELIVIIDQAQGVDRVVTLTAPAADVALAGVAALADTDAASITVTVNPPA